MAPENFITYLGILLHIYTPLKPFISILQIEKGMASVDY
jgi:hypothetical protein